MTTWTMPQASNTTITPLQRADGYRLDATEAKPPDFAASVYAPNGGSVGMIWRNRHGRWHHSLRRLPATLDTPASGWPTSTQAADALIAAYLALP